ncbi:hypothetical protein N8D74_06295 [Curtobacterium flaccumfaciens]|uniref:Uncharacterized protein n=1 Tax=Curtobacterium poinsettiae TaxID=159612 RepID=A0A9Q9P9L0_9MICO|nr:hypothetical protein [Curtobacterium flaccumfaciens]UXN26492.1 hypothetical protein N8D74_06295 [Curtobacterium flaccumfaciens]UYC81333.1 hypothetical protein OE229_02370 [Curtobacterium flaccumfaciens pv. poinsettiae]
MRHTDAPRQEHLLTMGLFDLVEDGAGGLDRRRNPVADAFAAHTRQERAVAAALSATT